MGAWTAGAYTPELVYRAIRRCSIDPVREEGMNSKGDLSEDATLQAKNAAQKSARPWLERLARLGYATEGAMYALIGLLAAGVAFGSGGHATGQRGALEIVAGSPFGGVLVGLIALGFLGYALWRGIQAITDPDGEGTDVKGIGKRAGYGVSALVYAGLAFSAVGLILGSASRGGRTPDDWTALLLSWPLGRALVVCAGLAVVGLGLRELYQAYKARFLKSRWGKGQGDGPNAGDASVSPRGGSSSVSWGLSSSARRSSTIRKRPGASAGRCRRWPSSPSERGCWAPWRSVWSPTGCLCSR